MTQTEKLYDQIKNGEISLCGCIGPQNNEPYCPCKMERIKLGDENKKTSPTETI